MRIALFHTTLPEPGRKPGGVEMAVHRLANALVAAGADVTVYSLSPAPASAQYRHRLLFGRRPFLRTSQLARLFMLPALLNLESFGDAEVIHFHGDDWFYLRRSKPTVRTLHGSALREAQSATSWKRRLSQYMVYPLERLSTALSRLPITALDDTARLYGIHTMVGYGVDTDLFHPGIKSGTPTIFYIGTWAGRKRGEFLFRLFTNEVLPRVPNARLRMACDYCPEHPAVTSEMFPNDERLAACYREAHLFAYPSTYEGFGLAYLEALASGTAVLTSPNQGADHILGGGKYGVISDDAHFAENIIDLLRSGSRRESLERVGLARAREFSRSAIARRHLEIYAMAAGL